MTVLVGRTTGGSGSTDFHGANRTGAFKFTAGAGGVLAKIWATPQIANPTGTTKLGIYSDDSANGRPGNLLASANTVGGNGVGPFSSDVSATALTIVNGTIYWLAWGNPTEQFDFKGDVGSYHEQSTFFPTPFGADATGSVLAIIWGEDAGAGGLDPFNPIPFMSPGRI